MAAPFNFTKSGSGNVASDTFALAGYIVALSAVADTTVALDAEVWVTNPAGTFGTPGDGSSKIAHFRALANTTVPLSFGSDGINIARLGQPQGSPLLAVKFNDTGTTHEVWAYLR